MLVREEVWSVQHACIQLVSYIQETCWKRKAVCTLKALGVFSPLGASCVLCSQASQLPNPSIHLHMYPFTESIHLHKPHLTSGCVQSWVVQTPSDTHKKYTLRSVAVSGRPQNHRSLKLPSVELIRKVYTVQRI